MSPLTVPGLLLDGDCVPPLRTYGGGTENLIDIVYAERECIFPGYRTVKFDLTFAHDFEEPLNADLSLIPETYDVWYLLLVEPSNDTDIDSLIANLKSISLHSFGLREARYLARTATDLDPSRIASLAHEQPNVLVITDDPRIDWSQRFTEAGIEAEIMIVEPFKVGDGYVIRVNGAYPSRRRDDLVGNCTEYPNLQNCLFLTSVGRFTPPEDGVLTIMYGSTMTRWQVLPGPGDAEYYLISEGDFPLQQNPPFELIVGENGVYAFGKT